MKKHLGTVRNLSLSSTIVNSQLFESAIVVLLSGSEYTLWNEEKSSLASLKMAEEEDSDSLEESTSIAQHAVIRQKTNTRGRTDYVDLRFLLLASDMCERFIFKWPAILSMVSGRRF